MEKIESINSSKHKLNWFYKIVCWCSGVRLYLLEKCPVDYNKFFGIGAIVIMTGIMASISGGYALYTIFNNYVIAIFFGIIWGVLIFSLDWYIVLSLKKENKFGREFLSATPRLILALLIAVVISKPLELKLFEKEIMLEVALMQRENALTYKALVTDEYDEIEKIEKQNILLLDEINKKETQKTQLFELIIEEAEGRSPTNKIGKGPVYKEKKTEFDQMQIDLSYLKKRNYGLIDNNLERISELKTKKMINLAKGEIQNKKFGGFLSRLNALSRMADKNQSVMIANWFIILLFIFIESAPMIVKLMSNRGAYDLLYESEERANSLVAEKQLAAVKSKQNEILNLNKELNEIKFKSLIEVETKFILKVYETKNELNELKIKKWKEKEIEEINKNADISIESIDKFSNCESKIYI